MNLEDLKEQAKNCEDCELHTFYDNVVFDTYKDVKIFILGEAPGNEEEVSGLPFQGRAGKLLNELLSLCSLTRDDVFCANTVVHRPLKNKKPNAKEINACRHFIDKQLQIIKPKVIITMGAVPTKTLVNEGAITKVRGNIYTYENIWVVPTLHPAYLLRGNNHLYPQVVSDIKKAIALIDHQDEDKYYVCCDSETECEVYLNNLKHKAKLFATDIECSGFNFVDKRIIGIGFSHERNHGFYIPEDFFTDNIIDRVKEVLTAPDKASMGFNFKFDTNFIRKNWGFKPSNFVFDPMLAHHLIDSSGRHSLEVLSSIYPDLAGYKEDTKKLMTKKKMDEMDFSELPLDKLSKRCISDCDATLRLGLEYYKKLEEIGLLDFYTDFVHPLQDVVSEIEYNGNIIDKDKLLTLKSTYEDKMKKIEAEIYAIVGHTFNLNSPKQLEEVLFKGKNKDGKIHPSIKKTKTGADSTDEEVLYKLSLKGFKIPTAIHQYRKSAKMVNSYINRILNNIASDGKYYDSYGLHKTVTGRLGSYLHTIPRENELRNCIIAPDGKVFITCDVSQLELKVLGAASKDPELLRVFKGGLDIHDETGKFVFKTDKPTTDERVRAKNVNFGVVYLISAKGLMEQINAGLTQKFVNGEITKKELTKKMVTEFEAEKFIGSFYMKYKGVVPWQKSVKRFAKNNGYIRNMFGRIRYFPQLNSDDREVKSKAYREVVNTYIQSSASDLVNNCILHALEKIKEHDLDIQVTLPVHDEITFVVDELEENVLEELAKKLKEWMLLGATKVTDVVPLTLDHKIGKMWSK